MISSFSIKTLPQIEEAYIVVRRTVWQVADPYTILLVVLEGECSVEMGSEQYELSPGSALLIPAAQSYRRFPAGDGMCKMMYIHFTPSEKIRELEIEEAEHEVSRLRAETEAALMKNRTDSLFSVNPLYLMPLYTDTNGELRNVAASMETLLNGLSADNALPLMLYFCQILSIVSRASCRMLRDRETYTEFRRVPAALKKAVWYVRQNYARRIALDELCRVSNLSKSQLIRLFRSEFDKTPAQYIIEFRINRAREIMLNAPDMSLKNVCAAVGFDDPHYFSRAFSKITGESPSAYRQRITRYLADERKNET
ncbi:MAG: helix-turn-helix domain-containing protein [Ruminococcaceae bacterium]|nr:helix-turn-helix domain-containing protein [Oscillospiraceae bacterium]